MKENKWTRGAIPAVLLHISIGSVYAWSLFVDPISKHIDASSGAVQFAFSLAIFFLGMSAAFGGKIVEKNIHISSIVSPLCFCGGLLLSALAVQLKWLWLLYLGYGCLMGIGLGIGYITPVKTLMLWFKDHKGLATGISVCAFGFASSIASPIITFLTKRCSLTMTFIILSGIYFIPMMIAHFLLKKPADWVEPQEKSDFKLMSMWKDKKFVIVWLIVFFNITCGLALISTASPIMKENGVSAGTITLVVSIMGVFNGAGRLAFSAASDKLIYRITMYQIIAFLSALTTGIVIFRKVPASIAISLIVISACYGAGFSCLPTLLSDLYGMKNISKIHGLSLTAWAIAGLVGNQISDTVHKITDSYNAVFWILAIVYGIELILALILKAKIKK